MSKDKEYIERDTVLQSFKEVKPVNWDDTEYERQALADYNFYHSIIETAPAADVAPVVHGEWIEYAGDPNIITCSECDWGTSPEEKGFKFCPNCGAKMKGE